MGELQWASVGQFYYAKPEHRSHYVRMQRYRMREVFRAEVDVESALFRIARMLMGMIADSGVEIALVGDDGILRLRAAMHCRPDQDAALQAMLGQPVPRSCPSARACQANTSDWRVLGGSHVFAVPIGDAQGDAIGSISVVRSARFDSDAATTLQEIAADLGAEITRWKHSGVWPIDPVPLDERLPKSFDVVAEVLAERRRSEPTLIRAMAEAMAERDDAANIHKTKAEWRARLNWLESQLQQSNHDIPSDPNSRRTVPIGKLKVLQRDRGVAIVWPPSVVSDQEIADAIHQTQRHRDDAGEDMVVMLVLRLETLVTPAQLGRLAVGLSNIVVAVFIWDQRFCEHQGIVRDQMRACRAFVGVTANQLVQLAPEDVQPDIQPLIELLPLWARA